MYVCETTVYEMDYGIHWWFSGEQEADHVRRHPACAIKDEKVETYEELIIYSPSLLQIARGSSMMFVTVFFLLEYPR